MRFRRLFCLFAVLLLMLPATAFAADLREPKLRYDADTGLLSWTAVSGASYQLYRANTTDELGERVYSGTKRTFAVTQDGVYRVAAFKGRKNSLYSMYAIVQGASGEAHPAPPAPTTPVPPDATPSPAATPTAPPTATPVPSLTGLVVDMGASGQWTITVPEVAGATAYRVYAAHTPVATPELAYTFAQAGTYQLHRDDLHAYYYTVECDTPQGTLRAGPLSRYDGLPSNRALTDTQSGAQAYRILVNKAAQVVTVYGKDDAGNYTIPVRHMLASTGKPVSRTPNGFYTIGGRQEWVDFNATWAHQGLELAGTPMLFHSVLYRRPDLSTLLTDTVDELGTPQSLGCIRLSIKDIDWMYRNIEGGTDVEIVSGSDKLAGLTSYLRKRIS